MSPPEALLPGDLWATPEIAGVRERRLKRPPADFLDLEQIQHVLAVAWDLAKRDRTSYRNALRVETAIFTGLRGAELQNLRVGDLKNDGTFTVRCGKGMKPRVGAFINGLEESPTRKKLLEFAKARYARDPSTHRPVNGGPLDIEESFFPTSHGAWHHWVCRVLAPAAGLKRRIQTLSPGRRFAPRYFLRPHAFRAAFVLLCRRLPRKYGLPPVPWESVCVLGGWDNLQTVLRYYYYVDMDEALSNVRKSFESVPALAPLRLPIDPQRPDGNRWRGSVHAFRRDNR